jgi:hypothetical protein
MIHLPMLLTILLAAATALVIRQVWRGNADRMNDATGLEGRTKPVDLIAFRNLMDPAQAQLLRGLLPVSEYRRLKRFRNGVAIGYVAAVYKNSATLVRLGEALQRQPDTAEEGAKIVRLALKNRFTAGVLLGKLVVGWVYPAGDFSTDAFTSDYSQLKESVNRILRRTRPLKGSHIFAGL